MAMCAFVGTIVNLVEIQVGVAWSNRKCDTDRILMCVLDIEWYGSSMYYIQLLFFGLIAIQSDWFCSYHPYTHLFRGRFFHKLSAVNIKAQDIFRI